jgi:hypothetical protein
MMLHGRRRGISAAARNAHTLVAALDLDFGEMIFFEQARKLAYQLLIDFNFPL